MENLPHEDREDRPDTSERRDFFAAAGKLAAVFGVLGLTSEAWAAEKRGLQMLLKDALKTGDMKAALRKHRATAKLSQKEVNALQSLSKGDLQALQRIQGKLRSLGPGTAADGNGIF